MSSHYFDSSNDPGMSFLEAYKMGNSPGFQSTVSDYSSAGESDDNKNAFSGAFSKDFGNSFLDLYKAGKLGQGGEKEKEDPYKPFTTGNSGGFSVTPVSSSTAFGQWQHPQATVIPAAQGGGGGGNPFTTIGGALIGAKLGGLKGAQLGASIGGSIG